MKITYRRKVAGILFSAVILVLMFSVLTPALGVKNKTIATVSTTGYGYGYCCDPHTPGYWKNHPESWPVETITIGGVVYSKTAAIEEIKNPGRGDKTYTMFEHLVAAKLNVLSGCDSTSIDDVIDDADAWMVAHPLGSGVSGSSDAWDDGEPLKNQLDTYNNS